MTSLFDTLACPVCDALYTVKDDQSLTCHRCHTRLVRNTRWDSLKVLILGIGSLGLIFGALTQPFLSIKRLWFENHATLVDVALAFDGPMLVVSILVLAMILLLPATRLLLNLYVLLPLVLDQPSFKHASFAFRWSERLRPWSMAEIFALGCGVALVKIADLAEITFGPAFWMFGILVVLLLVQDRLMCRYSMWQEVTK